MSKINEAPYKLVGYCYDDFVRWCDKHSKKVYLRSSKSEFFKLINNHVITHNYNGETFENGEKF